MWESSFGRRRVTCSILNLLCELNMPFVCKRPRNNNETILQFHPNNDKSQSFHVNALTLLRIISSQKKWHAPMGCLSQDSTGRQSANPLKRIDVETAQFSSVGSFLCLSPAQKMRACDSIWRNQKGCQTWSWYLWKEAFSKGTIYNQIFYIYMWILYIYAKIEYHWFLMNVYMFSAYINKY